MREPVNVEAFGGRRGGFSDAVRAPRDGSLLFISGLTSRDDRGSVVGIDDPELQMRTVLNRLDRVLEKAGATAEHVVQVRVLVRDVEQWAEMEPVFDQHWDGGWPACTLYEVSRLYQDVLLVEVDGIAVIP